MDSYYNASWSEDPYDRLKIMHQFLEGDFDMHDFAYLDYVENNYPEKSKEYKNLMSLYDAVGAYQEFYWYYYIDAFMAMLNDI